ncbi:MAG TPA: hypothetical protein VK157_17615 [Phycisphaerales bacterium]|nr:hypothetical protein [Phycisphaerales bacterium]
MDRASASKMTMLAQAGLGVGVLALGGVVFAGLKTAPAEDAGSEITVPEVKLPESVTNPTAKSNVRVDSGGTANRFGRVANSPKPVVVAPAEEPKTVQPVQQETLTYHGIANIGPRALGLVRVNGKQKFVSVGSVVSGDEKALEIAAEFIRVGANEPGRRIDLAAKAGGSVTLGTVSSVPVATAMDPSERLRMQQMERMRNMTPSMFSGEPMRAAKDVPEYIADADIPLFRKVRSRVLNDPRYAGQGDPNEIATKLMEDERALQEDRAAKGLPVELTPEEEQSEAAHLKQRDAQGVPR